MKVGHRFSGAIEGFRRRLNPRYRPRCRTVRRGWRVGAVAEAVECPQVQDSGSFLHMTTISNGRDSSLLRVSVYIRSDRGLATFDGHRSRLRQIAQIPAHSQTHAQCNAAYSNVARATQLVMKTTVTFKDQIDLDPLTQTFEGGRERLPVLEYFL